MAKRSKTNAMRILDNQQIAYKMYSYENNDGKIDGISVAKKIGKDVKVVYKTLVAQGLSKEIYVFIIPVLYELNVKLAAKAAGEKSLHLVPVKEIQKWTGYIRGGCSPIGMKKQYKTFLDERAKQLDTIIVSGGKIGTQIELAVKDLLAVTKGRLESLTQ
ncbi:Cys-tRNA(Pro) deacylase [Bacillus sp. FJAT-47783]|uniref:Cys-tRNA(Pro) deacylase n=1 Tax=Bacillus sp. FJAT-47783 TaxID=2922712 RepID=UPI001FAD04A6|nr:Cys-tRNA(Pro) deacylase [Bacillus sp. FJAT-47783]